MSIWAQAMLLWIWQALLVVGLVLIAVKIAPGRSAAARHSLWLLGILVIAVLPAANAAMPFLGWTPPVVAPITEVAQLPTLAIEAIPSIAEPPVESGGDLLIRVVFVFWIAGVVFSLGRFLRAHRRWSRIRASARIERGGLSVPLGYSDAIDVPVLVGVIRPTILLPADIEAWTDSEERRAILLHELAHVDRRDHWLNAFRAALGAIFFFHPAVRYALRQLVVERELACDERVLASGASRKSYAEVILKVAERTIHGRRYDCPAFDTSAEILERRIDMILTHQTSTQGTQGTQGTRERRTLPSIARAAIVLGFSALLLPNPGAATELPLAPSEIRFASMQPLMEGVSLVAEVIAEEEAVAQQALAPTQAATGTFSGTVFDQSGAVVPGVTVTLTAPAGVRTTISNETGAFTFLQVPAGPHSLQGRLPGFTNAARTVVVEPGVTSTRGILLQLATVATMVEVSASRPAGIQGAAPVAAAAGPRRIGGSVTQANLISQVKPQYPASARAAGIQDAVTLQGIIGTNGSLVGLQVVDAGNSSQNLELIKAVMDAVQQWQYRPQTLNGQPVPIATTITVNFSLN